MKKLTVLLLLLSMLLCMFASCQQPDVPPVDSDSETGSESESESESETLDITEAGWDVTIQDYWDTCIKNCEILPVELFSSEWNIAAPPSEGYKLNTYTKEAEIKNFMQALDDIVKILPTPKIVRKPGYVLGSTVTVIQKRVKGNSIHWTTGDTLFRISTICDDQNDNPTYNLWIQVAYIGSSVNDSTHRMLFTLTEEQYTVILETLHAII